VPGTPQLRAHSKTLAASIFVYDRARLGGAAVTTDSLTSFATEKLERLEKARLHRKLTPTSAAANAIVERDGRKLVSFASNDYLGLTQHPDVIAASVRATQSFGAGAGASRHVTGNHALYRGLEQALAAFKGTEDAVVFGSGYLTNIGVIPSLVGPDDLIVMDEYCHSCIHAGAALARSRVVRFAHNNASAAESLLRKHRHEYRHCLLLTEGVFSMDGDRAPLGTLAEIARAMDTWLMSDDAHGLGVIESGRGSGYHDGTRLAVQLEMGTLSKAVGAYGGYLCTSHVVADLVRNRARSLIYTTALPPGVVAAAIKSLEIIAADSELTQQPLRNARRFADLLGMREPESAIVPIVLGTPARALEASRRLEAMGYLVVAIRPPTVPDGTARLRCAFSAAHDTDTVDRFAAAVDRALVSL